MIPIANHLWQSTIFAAVAGLLALALRNNRAQVRYWLWMAASLKFLVPFSLLVSAGSQVAPRSKPVDLPATVAVAMEQVNQTLVPLQEPAIPRRSSVYWPALLWPVGSAAVVGIWWSGWRRMRDAVRRGSTVDLVAPIPILSSPTSIEPGVFGILRPVLLLPEGIWTRMPAEQFAAILAHELTHVRRRDNLASAIHMAVEALFWFHPLVWFIGARLVDERERACDEEVLRRGSDPETYAEGILTVCKFYLQSPLACAAGISGADLKKRIETIMRNRIAPALTAPRKALLAAAAALAVAGPVLIGMWNTPRISAQSAGNLTFEVASIKPATDRTGPLGLSTLPGGALRCKCPIRLLITFAYDIKDFQLSGGPSWLASDLYEVQATAERSAGVSHSAGPEQAVTSQTRERLRALLAERFHLVVRTGSKEAPVYVLSIAKNGHKLTPDNEAIGDRTNGIWTNNGEITVTSGRWEYFISALSNVLRQQVIDETKLSGRFNFKITFRPDYFGPVDKLGVPVIPPDTSGDPRPSIFTAIQEQLGLRLDAQKRPTPEITIERIERPTEN